MLIHLHQQATTTPKVRAAIQASDEPASVLAERFGSLEDQKTVRGAVSAANGMVERFNDRIEEVLQSHHFRSGEESETTLHRNLLLYNQQLPWAARPACRRCRTGTNSNLTCSGNNHTT